MIDTADYTIRELSDVNNPLHRSLEYSNNTSKVVLICFPEGSARKTLANCLGFSDGAVLQDLQLAIQQIRGEITVADKFNIIMNRLKSADINNWDDLNMQVHYLLNNEHRQLPEEDIPALLSELYNSNKYFFIGLHKTGKLRSIGIKHFTARFPNARAIIIENHVRFIQELNRPPYNTQKIRMPNFDRSLIKGQIDTFDPMCFLDGTYVNVIRNLYDTFGFVDFNETYIREYVEFWKKIITRA